LTLAIPTIHDRWPALLADMVCPGLTPHWVLRTGTRTDTGLWWRRPRIWLGLYDDVLVLLAAGPEPLLRCLGRENLTGTTYNHVTGRLLLAQPMDKLSDNPEPVAALAMGPIDAQRVLRWLQGKETPHA